MLKEIFSNVYQNKNLLMFFTVLFYVLGIIVALSGYTLILTFGITLLVILAVITDIFSPKQALIWIIIFYIGLINTIFRLKDTDDLLSLAPRNASIYGKILTIPQNKNGITQKFFFKVDKIEYDSIVKELKDEKVLVSINSKDKFMPYDSYKIRGRLSGPFKAGNPSQFDYGNYLRNYNTYAVFYAHNPYGWTGNDECYEKLVANYSKSELILRKINNYRDHVIKIHSKYLKSPNLEILGGIVFGDDAVNPPENIRQSFINSGLLHILAASGMNVAFIFSFFFFILNLFKINYKVNILICILAVITYILMTGLGASVVRAGLMLLFVLAGKLIDRDAHSIALLSFVGMLMLIYNPMLINDVGFQLSFIVTFGLLISSPYILRHKNRIINWLIGSITVPIIAQLWVIPIQIFYFNNISLYSVFANIISVPILAVISFGGFISSLLIVVTPLSMIICKLFDIILNPLITILVKISDFWSSLPHSSIQTTHPNIIQLLLYYGLLLLLVCLFDDNIRNKYKKFLITTISIFLSLLLLSSITIPNHNLEIISFDVGNADSFLIKTPENKYLMIDTGKNGYNGGKSQAEIIMLKYFKDRGIKKLDSVIITHFDNDHCGGAVDLIKDIKIDKLYVNNLNHESNIAKEIYITAKKYNTKVIEADNNQNIYNNNDLTITNFISKEIIGIGDNESSIITLLKYKNFSMLFTGDSGTKSLYSLIKYLPRNLTVLKVGHHGASGSINKELTDYFNPKISLISTGENKFGHPSIYTLTTLKNSQILRTDINNAILFKINKNGYKIYTYNSLKRKFEQKL